MTARSIRAVFLTGAIFNWLVGLTLHYDAALLFRLFHVTPVPAEPLFVRLFAWLVIVFGIGYYWVSRGPRANAPIIRLGILGKLSVVLVCLASFVAHTASWQLLILAAADLLYAVLFWWALRAIPQSAA